MFQTNKRILTYERRQEKSESNKWIRSASKDEKIIIESDSILYFIHQILFLVAFQVNLSICWTSSVQSVTCEKDETEEIGASLKGSLYWCPLS